MVLFFRRMMLFRLVLTLGLLGLGMTVRAVQAAVTWASYHRTPAEVMTVESSCSLAHGGVDPVDETDCGRLRTFYASAGPIAQVTTVQVRYLSPADGRPHQATLTLTGDAPAGGLPEVGRPWTVLASSDDPTAVKPL